MIGRPLACVCALAFAIAALGGCSTGVAEADRAIFVNACAGTTGATQADCACAYDDLSGSGGSSDQLIQSTIDDLQRGRVPQQLTRAIARCSTPR
ncbi:MAG: hypothetical protein AVDCRST_MAG45-585 [uncultured Solirubrobacterales bacterium]|uniref:Lipoprotein n=1 Tax=uncultured Solirubrobacterales bacterium TaxID=768556 RepID=A0A6J4S2Q3_9ACTN|nr:MAG: hypothetical protein AVDCRST_MAG45-585 [uncultured Solirubrobacterales bacterium]